jgi:integrase
MPKLRLTKENIQHISSPTTGEVFYWDTKYKGFGLRVRPASMTYVVQIRVKDGTMIRVKIGRHGIFTPDQAEKQARTILSQIALGENPHAKHEESRACALTLRELYAEYMANKKLRPKTVQTYDGAMRRCFSDWMDKPVVAITKDMVQKRHREISNANGPRGKGEAHANQALRTLRCLLNYAAVVYEDASGRPIIPENPVRRLTQTRTWNKVPRRQNVILPEELEGWYKAVATLDNDVMRDYLLFCLFTGLRRTEAMTLKWKHVRLDSKLILIPAENTKAGREHGLPLSDFLHALLLRRSRVRRIDNEYVFPAKQGSGHMIEPKRAIDQVVRLSGIKFKLHDLRRTFETIAERLDISYYALKRLINHSLAGDVTAGYIIIDIERLREPMQRITDFIKLHAAIQAEVPAQTGLLVSFETVSG